MFITNRKKRSSTNNSEYITLYSLNYVYCMQGISVGPLVEKLGVKKSQKRELTMNERIHERSLDHIMAGVEDIMGHPGRHYVRNM